MPTWAPLDDDPTTGDDIPTAFLELEGRTDELRSCFVGSTPPDDPTEGQLWLDNSSVPHRLFVYAQVDGGPASWQPVGPLSRLPDSPNGDPSAVGDRADVLQFLALRIENRADLPALTPTNAGLLVYRIGDGEVFVADEPISSSWKGLLSITQSGSYDTVELPLEGDVGNDATNPPTQQRVGVLEGWLFDGVAEKRTLAFTVPRNWNGASDLRVRLHQVLSQAEAAGNDIEWSGEVRTLALSQEKVGKAATALVDGVTDIGAIPDGIDVGGGPHVTELVIDHDDAANPVSTACLVLVTIWRKSIGGAGLAGGTVLFRAELAYAQSPRHERV